MVLEIFQKKKKKQKKNKEQEMKSLKNMSSYFINSERENRRNILFKMIMDNDKIGIKCVLFVHNDNEYLKDDAINDAIEHFRPDILEILLKKVDPNDYKYSKIPLHTAAKVCNHEAMKMLLEQGANVNMVDNSSSENTPLGHAMYSVGKMTISTVRLLLENGANPNDMVTNYTDSSMRYRRNSRRSVDSRRMTNSSLNRIRDKSLIGAWRRKHQTVGMVPPSMTNSVPVMADARSDSTKVISSATSSGRLGRPNGIPPNMSISFCRADS